MSNEAITGADLLLRLGVDAAGTVAEVTSALTASERVAVQSGNRISANVATNTSKVQVATLRVAAAQERYNETLKKEGATTGQVASAQASLITAQNNLNKAQATGTTNLREGAAAAKGIAIALATVGAAAGAYVLSSVGKFQELATEVRNVQRLTGLTAEDASKLRFAAQESGVGVDVLSAGLRTLETHLTKNDAAAKNLGITYRDAAGQLLPFDDILAGLANRFEGMADGPEKTALAVQLLGKQGVALLPLLNRGAAGFDELAQKAEKLGLVLNGSNLDAVKRNSQANKDLKSSVESLQVAMGSRSLPVITKFKEAAADALGFAAEHEGVTSATTAVLGLGAAFGKAGAFASNLNEISAAVSSALHLRAPSTVAANAAVARSYDGIATSASRAATAEEAASIAGGGGGRLGGRVTGRRLGGLAAGGLLLAGGASGQVGAATGSTFVNDAASIGGAALTGGSIGSLIAPGVGTAIGAGVGAAAGIGLSVLGTSKAKATTARTPAEIKQDLAGVNAELKALQDTARRTNVDNPARIVELGQQQRKLNTELEVSRTQAKQTFQVFDAGTGAVKQLTAAQIAAAAAADKHKAALATQRQELQQLTASFAVDPFAARPTSGAASATDIRVAELRLRSAQQRARTKGTTDTERAAVLSAQQRLDALRSKGGPTGLSPAELARRIEGQSADQEDRLKDFRKLRRQGASRETLDALNALDLANPGTVDRLAGRDSRAYIKAFNKGMREQKQTRAAIGRLFDNSDTLAEQAGRRAAARFRAGVVDELGKIDVKDYFTNLPGTLAGATPGVSYPAQKAASARRRSTP